MVFPPHEKISIHAPQIFILSLEFRVMSIVLKCIFGEISLRNGHRLYLFVWNFFLTKISLSF